MPETHLVLLWIPGLGALGELARERGAAFRQRIGRRNMGACDENNG